MATNGCEAVYCKIRDAAVVISNQERSTWCLAFGTGSYHAEYDELHDDVYLEPPSKGWAMLAEGTTWLDPETQTEQPGLILKWICTTHELEATLQKMRKPAGS